MKKIISFSLWGNDPKYLLGAIENAKLTPIIYPGWISRFYIGQSTIREFPKIVSCLKSFSHVEIVEMDEEGGWAGMFWRFLACSDSDVEVVLSRDTDSRLNIREHEAVMDWMKSGRSFHIMRDHPLHRYLILGGMWGAKTEKLRKMGKWVSDFKKDDYWNIDQEFLEQIVYPKIRKDCIVHDEFIVRRPFPKKRVGLEFVGEVFDQFNNPEPTGRAMLKNELEKRGKISWRINDFMKRSITSLRSRLK